MGIGTTNPLKLAVEGAIGARDIIVTNAPWSDYVFRPGYRLRPLSEVSAFIQKHRHLPDIPTEVEVKGKGVSLGDMQAKLLAKVEELTLHARENNALRIYPRGTNPKWLYWIPHPNCGTWIYNKVSDGNSGMVTMWIKSGGR